MAQSKSLILRLISSCIPIANQAGKIIRDVMKKGELNIVHKGVEDYQTEADRLAQLFIVSALSRQYPNITVIGEEDVEKNCFSEPSFTEFDESVLEKECPEKLINVDENQVTVWVDPLDGTSEYTQGLLEHVTVLIGIAVDDKAVAGVIHQPYYCRNKGDSNGRTIWGLIGLGAFGYTPLELPSDRVILTTTRSHSTGLVQEAVESLKANNVIRVGGAGHKVILLLEGKAHAYVFASEGCKRWDTCAPEAVLHAAGGLLTDMNGKIYKYNKETNVKNIGGVLATAKKDQHSKFLNLLPDYVKQKFRC